MNRPKIQPCINILFLRALLLPSNPPFLSFYDLNFNPWSSRVSQETKWSQLDALYIVIVVMLWASAFMKIQHSSTKSCSATLSGPSNACLALKDGRETSLGPLTVQKKKTFWQQKMILQGQIGGRNRKSSDATVRKVLRNYCKGPARQYQCQGFKLGWWDLNCSTIQSHVAESRKLKDLVWD